MHFQSLCRDDIASVPLLLYLLMSDDVGSDRMMMSVDDLVVVGGVCYILSPWPSIRSSLPYLGRAYMSAEQYIHRLEKQ
jgi:hypothetical protein